MRDAVKGVSFVIFIRTAEEMAAARAAHHFTFAIGGDFQRAVKLEQSAPAVFCALSAVRRQLALPFTFGADFLTADFGGALVNAASVSL